MVIVNYCVNEVMNICRTGTRKTKMCILLENMYHQGTLVCNLYYNAHDVLLAKFHFIYFCLPGANFYPLLGCYSSKNPVTVGQHMKWIRQAGIGVLVISWYPPDLSIHA